MPAGPTHQQLQDAVAVLPDSVLKSLDGAFVRDLAQQDREERRSLRLDDTALCLAALLQAGPASCRDRWGAKLSRMCSASRSIISREWL